MKITAAAMALALLTGPVEGMPQDDTFQKIPFEQANGLILVQASVNGDTGSFILETGLPMVLVNPRNVSGLQLSQAPGEAGLRGQPVLVKHFAWAGIEREGLEALAMDMSQLEKASQRKILGVIGYEVLSKYELMFDSRNQVLLIYESKNSWVHLQRPPSFSLPFKLQGKMLAVSTRIGGKKVRLGIDAGGACNLMSEEMLGVLPAASHSLPVMEKAPGFGAYKKAADIYDIQAGGKGFPASRFIFTDLSELEHLKLDGLLGMPFLSKYRFSVNYRKGEIYFWPHGAEINYRRT